MSDLRSLLYNNLFSALIAIMRNLPRTNSLMKLRDKHLGSMKWFSLNISDNTSNVKCSGKTRWNWAYNAIVRNMQRNTLRRILLFDFVNFDNILFMKIMKVMG